MRPPLLLLTLLLCGCGRPTVQEVVQLGQVVPLTGPDAALGEQAVNGMSLAVDALNAGEPAGVNTRRVQVVHADAGPLAEGLVAQAVRLDTLNHVAAQFGGVTTEQAGRLSANFSSPTPILITAAGGMGTPTPANTFAVGISPTEQGRVLARWAVGEASLRREGRGPLVLLSNDRVATSLAAREAFEREYVKDGRSVRVWATDDTFDLAGRTKEVVAGKPAGVVVFGSVPDLLKIRRWLLRADWPAAEPILFAGDGEAVPTLLAERDPPGAGAVVVSAFDPADTAEPAKGFIERYRGKFGQPPTVHAALAHDALNVYAEAARRAKVFRTDKVREELVKLADIDIVTGKFSFNSDQTARRPAFVLRVADGQTARLARIEPEPSKPVSGG